MNKCLPPAAILLFSIAAARAADLPEGKGKDAVENACTECHSTRRIQEQHLDEDGWNGIIREMVETGASIDPDEKKLIVDYLTRNFGPEAEGKININRAPVDKIASVLQITTGEAEAIARYRAENGDFKTVADVEKVPGLAGKIEPRKTLITF